MTNTFLYGKNFTMVLLLRTATITTLNGRNTLCPRAEIQWHFQGD